MHDIVFSRRLNSRSNSPHPLPRYPPIVYARFGRGNVLVAVSVKIYPGTYIRLTGARVLPHSGVAALWNGRDGARSARRTPTLITIIIHDAVLIIYIPVYVFMFYNIYMYVSIVRPPPPPPRVTDFACANERYARAHILRIQYIHIMYNNTHLIFSPAKRPHRHY